MVTGLGFKITKNMFCMVVHDFVQDQKFLSCTIFSCNGFENVQNHARPLLNCLRYPIPINLSFSIIHSFSVFSDFCTILNYITHIWAHRWVYMLVYRFFYRFIGSLG